MMLVSILFLRTLRYSSGLPRNLEFLSEVEKLKTLQTPIFNDTLVLAEFSMTVKPITNTVFKFVICASFRCCIAVKPLQRSLELRRHPI